MEVMAGCKQAAVGTVPGDWDVGLLRDLVDPARTIRYGIVQPGRRDPNGRYMIRGQDYSKGWVDPSELFRVSPAVEEPFANARVRAGDVLITIVGASTGRIAIVPVWLDGANLTQTTARIAPRSERVDGTYCSYVLASSIGSKQVSNYLKGAAQPGLNCGDIEKFLIPLPPLPEQRAIAQALNDVDTLLRTQDRLIAKKRGLRQAVMQQLLSAKTRLPGFSGEWELKRLGDLCALKSGEGITAKSIDDVSPFPCYGGHGLRGFTARFTHEGDYCLIGRVGALCGNLLKVTGRFYASEHAIVATAFEDVDIGWLTLALGTLDLNRRAESSAQPVLTVSKLLPLEIFAPPTREEQAAIATILQDMSAELAILETRRDKTQALKQAMMHELLTGKTRLVAPDVPAA